MEVWNSLRQSVALLWVFRMKERESEREMEMLLRNAMTLGNGNEQPAMLRQRIAASRRDALPQSAQVKP